MGLFSGLFGSSESTTEIPSWIKGPAQDLLARSESMGRTGFMPWMGPDVAAISQPRVDAMRNNVDMARAFGMQARMPTLPQAEKFGPGVWGYSSFPMFDQAVEALRAERPGQVAHHESHFVDPQTGAMPGMQTQQAQPMQAGMSWTMHPDKQGMDIWSDQAVRSRIQSGGSASDGPGYMAPTSSGGGYTGLSDMFDGGGPGASGDTFGGLLGGISNARGRKPGDGLLGGLF